MTGRYFACLGLAGILWLAAQPADAQTSSGNKKSAAVPRTPWGQPDLQGVWTTDAEQGVPIERPAEFGDRPLLNERELAKRDAELKKRARDDKEDRYDDRAARPANGEGWR